MSNAIQQYFATDRGFASGLSLYQKTPGANRALATTLSRLGKTPQNTQHLHYELAKLGGISERQLKAILSKPISKSAPKPQPAQQDANPSAPQTIPAKYADIKKLAAELGLKTPNQKKATLIEAITKHYEQKKS